MQIKENFNVKWGEDQVWCHFFWLEQNMKRKRGEEKRKRGEEKRKKKKKKWKKKEEPRKVWKVWNLYKNAMILYGNYLGMDC